MTRLTLAAIISLGLIVPAHALPAGLSMPHLIFPTDATQPDTPTRQLDLNTPAPSS